MTKEELIKKLTEIAESAHADPEAAHASADDALLDYINDEEVTNRFDSVEKWYA